MAPSGEGEDKCTVLTEQLVDPRKRTQKDLTSARKVPVSMTQVLYMPYSAVYCTDKSYPLIPYYGQK